MNCSVGHYIHSVQASLDIALQASWSDAMAVNSTLRTGQTTSWHFLLATDGVASRGIPAHQRPTAVGEVAGGGGRKTVRFCWMGDEGRRDDKK